MKKRIAVVTGGMGGIGNAICELLHNNFTVVAAYNRDHESAKLWQQEKTNNGFYFHIAFGNVTQHDSCQAMINKIENDIGSIDVLVNNAGITRDCVCSKMNPEEWDIVINTDLSSVFYVTRAVINSMKERQYGRIINISSINGQKGQYGQVNYAAAKAGMHGFTKALALEVAKKGITVNTISPGYVATDMVLKLPQNIQDKILAEIPMGRFATPLDIARMVAFIADEQSSYLTGANIPINGGHYLY